MKINIRENSKVNQELKVHTEIGNIGYKKQNKNKQYATVAQKDKKMSNADHTKKNKKL